MGFLDKVKQMLGGDSKQADAVVHKTAEAVEDHTPETADTVVENAAEETKDAL